MNLLFINSLILLVVPALMALPFYFFNKYLIRKIRPRESGKQMLIYFFVMTTIAFIYIGIVVFLIIWVTILLKSYT